MKIKSFQVFLAVFFAFLIPFNQVQASQMVYESTSQIKEILNELNYSMDVVWDQKDPSVRKQIEQRFFSQLVELHRQGASDTEILTELKQNAIDAQSARDLDAMITYAKANQLSVREVSQLVAQFTKQTYFQGASWSGLAVGFFVYALIGFAILFIAIIGIPYLISCIAGQCLSTD